MPERAASTELDVTTDAGRAELRRLAEAAREQLSAGPAEWPGRPSRQRLELFMATGPVTVLTLLDLTERQERES